MKEHIAGCLPIKELTERALYEVGGVPKAYEIKVILQCGSPGSRIIFSNTADEYRAQKTGEEIPGECGIMDCVNEGPVTAPDLAAGICSRLEDQKEGQPPVNSVQELVENFGFGEREPEVESSVSLDHTMHHAVRNCKNYGTITVKSRWDEDAGKYTQAAGICANLHLAVCIIARIWVWFNSRRMLRIIPRTDGSMPISLSRSPGSWDLRRWKPIISRTASAFREPSTLPCVDSLWKLAETHTGDGWNYVWLADWNHRKPSDTLYVGDLILLSDDKKKERERISMSYLYPLSE